MNVAEIVKEIREMLPNALSDSDLIRKMNNIQNELFRTDFLRVTMTQYDVLTDIPFYPLGFSTSKVRDLTVNGVEYAYKNTKGKGASQFYYFVNNDEVGIFPVPTVDITGGLLVFHDKEPEQLRNTGQVPDLDNDFHMLLAYGTCSNVAKGMLNTDLANAFISDYNDLLSQLKKSQREPDYPVIQNVYEGLI